MGNPFADMIATDRLQWVLEQDADGCRSIIAVEPGAPDRTISARVRYEPQIESVASEDGLREYAEAIVLVANDPVLGRADPAEGDEYQFDGRTWVQVGIEARVQENYFRLRLRHTRRVQANAATDYRRSRGG